MERFADFLHRRIETTGSVLCVGLDPLPEHVPTFLTNALPFPEALLTFLKECIACLDGHCACIKPNIAFFESLGVQGISVCIDVCAHARALSIPVIIDAKRGDIGSTSEAYARAFLGSPRNPAQGGTLLHADALTVNPFLGFDTLEPFIAACRATGKGLYVLARTSNPGATALQSLTHSTDHDSASERIARWAEANAADFVGECGLSGLGLVLGATNALEAARLRSLAPRALALIPGMGAQGGTAETAVAGFRPDKRGAVINISRALCGDLGHTSSLEQMRDMLSAKAISFNEQISKALN